MEGWREVDRHGFTAWLHISKPVWVVVYPKGPGNPDHDLYRAYKALRKPKKDQMPWAVDNRGLNKDGYATLAEAMAAGESA